MRWLQIFLCWFWIPMLLLSVIRFSWWSYFPDVTDSQPVSNTQTYRSLKSSWTSRLLVRSRLIHMFVWFNSLDRSHSTKCKVPTSWKTWKITNSFSRSWKCSWILQNQKMSWKKILPVKKSTRNKKACE